MEAKIQIRNMEKQDIDGVLIIEHSSFATPWSRQAFINELEYNRFANYLVMEYNDEIIGYCGLWVIIDEAHITNIAIKPEYRGKKLGELLLKHSLQVARQLGGLKLSLEVRLSNCTAQNLYKKFGFQPGGIRKNYYIDNQEDALVMWVMLNEQPIG